MVMRGILCAALTACWWAAPRSGPVDERELKKEDLLFTRMEVDKREVYQGEAILLTMQVWRIQYRSVDSGVDRKGLIVAPSTEGFYVTPLEPVSFTASKGSREYHVTEERKLLYPTALGRLEIGAWHWEGMALIHHRNAARRDRRFARNRLHYELGGGPIEITVKPLPEPPAGFSGAVGAFEIEASLGGLPAGAPGGEGMVQGVPVALTVRVTGHGNPDAMGEPFVPAMDWAFAGEAETQIESVASPGTGVPAVSKRFVYPITPLRAGPAFVPEIRFVFFDPDNGVYRTERAGPFPVSVLPSPESSGPRAAAVGPAPEGRRGRGPPEDVFRPVVERPARLRSRRSSPLRWPAVIALPVFLYAALAAYRTRIKRFEQDAGSARSHQARPRARKRLGGAEGAAEPAEEVYRAVVGYVADTLHVGSAGMTPEDVEGLLVEEGVDPGRRAGVGVYDACGVVDVLKACERARYGTQEFSRLEVRALVEAARLGLDRLDRRLRRLRGERADSEGPP